MGKNSLIKATDKKQSGAKKEPAETKKKSAKKSEAKPKKPPSKKNPAKKAAPAKAKAAPKVKKVAVKDLVLKKFEPLTPWATLPQPKKPAAPPEAPPIIKTSDPKEAQRLRALLSARFDMAQVRAAAEAPSKPAPPKAEPAAQPEPEPRVAETAASVETEKAQPEREQHEEVKPVITTAAADFTDAGSDPMQKVIKYAVAGFALILVLIIGASVKNSAKYYVKAKGSAIEIWRGDFSPTGNSFFIALPGVQPPQEEKAVYAREDVFPLAFNYYLEKADSLLDTPGLPDYESIRNYVNQASAYAVGETMRQAVKTRLNTIDRMALLYKADVDFSKGTAASLDNAVKHLKEAQRLTDEPTELEIIKQKIAAAEQAKVELTAKPPEK